MLRAEGEAEAAKLIADAISDHGPGLVSVRKIEAAQHIADTLKASPNVTFLSGNTVNMLNLGGAGMWVEKYNNIYLVLVRQIKNLKSLWPSYIQYISIESQPHAPLILIFVQL